MHRRRLEQDVTRVTKETKRADHENTDDEKARERIHDRRHPEADRQARRKCGNRTERIAKKMQPCASKVQVMPMAAVSVPGMAMMMIMVVIMIVMMRMPFVRVRVVRV